MRGRWWCSTCCSGFCVMSTAKHHVAYAANVTDVDDKINKQGRRGRRPDRRDHRSLSRRLPRRHVGAGRAATDVPAAGDGDDGARSSRMIGRLAECGRGLSGRGPCACSTPRPTADYGQPVPPLPGRHDRRRAGRGGALQAPPGRLRAVEALQAGRAGVGKPVRAGASGLAYRMLGDDRRRRWAFRSTSMAVASTWCSRTTRTKWRRACAPVTSGYANYWMHNGFLNMDDEKMSKSVGNVSLVHDLVTQWPPEALCAGRCWRRTIASRWPGPTRRSARRAARSTRFMARWAGPRDVP